MDESALISVVTPFFNAARFLRAAIESVLAQTHDPWELLLVDDGGDDDSETIARAFARRYPDRIRYLCHDPRANRGKCTSRNLGIAQARGDFVALLDADDVFLPQKLSEQIALLRRTPEASMVYGPTQYWYGWTGAAKDRRRDRTTPLGLAPGTLCHPPHLLTHFLRTPGAVPCTCGILARRKAVVDCGAFEETSQHVYEDQVFFSKLCLQGPVLVDAGCWSRYRQHAASTCHTAIRDGEYHPYLPNPAREAYLDWLGRYLRDLDVADDALWRAYELAWEPYRPRPWLGWLGPGPRLLRSARLRLASRFGRRPPS